MIAVHFVFDVKGDCTTIFLRFIFWNLVHTYLIEFQ